MLKELITSQKKAYSANLDPHDSVEPLLGNLKRKGEISTAVLLLEGEDRPTILFIFQSALYAAYKLDGNGFKRVSFSDYFAEMSHSYGVLSLYLISPVLFKALLVLAQSQPTAVVSSDMIDNDRLLGNINRDKKDAVLSLMKEHQLNLFYFREGTLCDGYFEANTKNKSGDLKDAFITFTDFSKAPPAQIALYQEITVSPAEDQDAAEEQIASITPSDIELWSDAEDQIVEDEVEAEHGQWAIEFLSGDQAGTIIDLVQKRATIGRGMGDIRLSDPQVSRHHADLEQSEGTLIVVDQKSTNGLFVNGERVTRQKVSDKDTIRLGDTTIKVVLRS